MKPESLKYLFDIKESIELVESHLTGIEQLAAYREDKKTIDAIERRLAIIGEALWKATKLEPELSITNKNKIIGLRHILVHDYDLIDDDTIWTICKKYLPLLQEEILTILPK